MRDAQEYLSDRQFGKLAFECDASELHFINPCYDAFRVGQVIHCISKPHLLSCDLPLTKMSLRLDEATKQITLGSGTEKSLTEAASDGFYTGQGGDEPGLAGDTEDWKHWIGTQAEYDALKEQDFKTVYFIEAEETS